MKTISLRRAKGAIAAFAIGGVVLSPVACSSAPDPSPPTAGTIPTATTPAVTSRETAPSSAAALPETLVSPTFTVSASLKHLGIAGYELITRDGTDFTASLKDANGAELGQLSYTASQAPSAAFHLSWKGQPHTFFSRQFSDRKTRLPPQSLEALDVADVAGFDILTGLGVPSAERLTPVPGYIASEQASGTTGTITPDLVDEITCWLYANAPYQVPAPDGDGMLIYGSANVSCTLPIAVMQISVGVYTGTGLCLTWAEQTTEDSAFGSASSGFFACVPGVYATSAESYTLAPPGYTPATNTSVGYSSYIDADCGGGDGDGDDDGDEPYGACGDDANAEFCFYLCGNEGVDCDLNTCGCD